MWSVFAERFQDSDFSGTPRMYQPFTVPKLTKVKSARLWFVFKNSPTFSGLSLRIHADQSGVLTDQLFTFDTVHTLATALSTYGNGLKELYFDVANPIWLHPDTTYHLAPIVSGSTLTEASHIAWVRGFPDPNTDTSVTISSSNIGRIPFYMSFIGADK